MRDTAGMKKEEEQKDKKQKLGAPEMGKRWTQNNGTDGQETRRARGWA